MTAAVDSRRHNKRSVDEKQSQDDGPQAGFEGNFRAKVQRIVDRALWTSHHYWLIASLCLLTDAALTLLIISAVRFTEIDYQTYMQQTALFLKGERRYDHITGDTGPCVYPALHLYICSFLSVISAAGKQVQYAQIAYALLYLVSQLLTMAIYKAARVPPILLPVLVLSKRLHSIYVLRLFNDCWAATLMSASIWAMCSLRNWGLASSLFSLALGVKMNILLYAPAMAVVYLRALGLRESTFEAVRVLAIQALLGGPFLLHDAKAYFSSAFDLSRAFLYEWTVNWRMVDEKVFLDKRFALTLLLTHLTVIAVWLSYRWTPIIREGSLAWVQATMAGPSKSERQQPNARFIVVSLFTSNVIGITFARSLHYQFYSWYAQQIPLLVYVSSLPLAFKLLLPPSIEWCWNTFPSTPLSSSILLASHLVLLFGLWAAKDDDSITDEWPGPGERISDDAAPGKSRPGSNADGI